jgi:monothiol glutaredoxin
MSAPTAPEIDVAAATGVHGAEGAMFVDVRSPDAFHEGRIPGATWLHGGNVQEFINGADKSKPLVVYCYKGNASKGATLDLLASGFADVKSLAGGMTAWREAGSPLAQGAPKAEAPKGFGVAELAKTKLEQYLSGESEGTCVRVTADGGWGLALDSSGAGDVVFMTDGLEFVVAGQLLDGLKGLTIGFIEEVNKTGFSFEGAELPAPAGKAALLEDIKSRISSNKVMAFIKGTAGAPRCGFSAKVVEALSKTGKPFGDKNVLEIPEYRYVLSEHSSWPTIPQIFIDGKFVGGCDILLELDASGELQKLVDAATS